MPDKLRHLLSLILPFLMVVVLPYWLLTLLLQATPAGKWSRNRMGGAFGRICIIRWRIRPVCLVHQTVCTHRSRHAGALGPDPQPGCQRTLSPRAQSDDLGGGDDAGRIGLVLGLCGHGFLHGHFCADQPHLLHIFRRAGIGETLEEDYRIYKANVPRWIPRSKPWSGE